MRFEKNSAELRISGNGIDYLNNYKRQEIQEEFNRIAIISISKNNLIFNKFSYRGKNEKL